VHEHVLGLSWGSMLASGLYQRHPDATASLVLTSAYAGWAGSLPPDEVRRRLRQVCARWRLPPERDMLSAITVPTLLLYGDADVRSPVRVGEELQARIPGSALVVLPGAAHLANVEAPDLFNGAVRGFLGGIQG
jgi:pimeloyl-ACP methyl ester carboxylesterase